MTRRYQQQCQTLHETVFCYETTVRGQPDSEPRQFSPKVPRGGVLHLHSLTYPLQLPRRLNHVIEICRGENERMRVNNPWVGSQMARCKWRCRVKLQTRIKVRCVLRALCRFHKSNKENHIRTKFSIFSLQSCELYLNRLVVRRPDNAWPHNAQGETRPLSDHHLLAESLGQRVGVWPGHQ